LLALSLAQATSTKTSAVIKQNNIPFLNRADIQTSPFSFCELCIKVMVSIQQMSNSVNENYNHSQLLDKRCTST
jgi:hypothetical protein